MGRIEKLWGKSLPLDTLFQAATIERLVDILRQEAAPSDSLLVAIQPEGEKPPFFCVHPIGGSVVGYAEVARCLGVDQPFYGLRARGLHGEAECFSDIEAMAASYLEEIRAREPEGPYLLGGWSLGGIVAFEMAHQLVAQGKSVALLALLDVDPSELDDDGGIDLAKLFIEDLAQQFGKEVPFSEKSFQQTGHDALATHERIARMLYEARRAEWMPDLGPVQMRDLARVYAANAGAARTYKARMYPGRITVFRAIERAADSTSSPDLGWGRLSEDGVDVHVVPGNHYTMLREPNVQVLAERLGACLDEARSGSRRRGGTENSEKEPC